MTRILARPAVLQNIADQPPIQQAATASPVKLAIPKSWEANPRDNPASSLASMSSNGSDMSLSCLAGVAARRKATKCAGRTTKGNSDTVASKRSIQAIAAEKRANAAAASAEPPSKVAKGKAKGKGRQRLLPESFLPDAAAEIEREENAIKKHTALLPAMTALRRHSA